MLIGENMRLAFTALWANKVRALLTMLGIIIGIGSVIAIMTVGNSLSNSLSTSMQGMGANNVNVGLQKRDVEEEASKDGFVFGTYNNANVELKEEYRITDEMLEAYQAEYGEFIEGIELTEAVGSGTAKDGDDYANLAVLGVNDFYFQAEDVTLVAGRLFSEKDQQKAGKVAIVSDRMVDNVYGGSTSAALGSGITVNMAVGGYAEYTIVGVYEYVDSGVGFVTSTGYDVETNLYVPYQTAKNENHSSGGYSQLTVVTAIGVDSDEFASTTQNYFNRYYRRNKNYQVSAFSMASMLEAMTSMLDSVSIAIAIVAAISLLVGGIGVMNIMLVSVTERTREIGTRKALGAKNSSIRTQFIFEAVVICLVGGVIGILIGVALGALGSRLLGFPATPSVASIVLSVSFSIAIGVFFGYYPANRASKLDPIEALRYE